ncbi:predicted protein [Naegleria gruberi]|uniref:Predicted protein n=1 Tax=Naegleria gruberi TaxID=5762 RepID=D2W3W4_NAEGR|nr:uncharacterized protein NAEGRDRAFT_82273 [Naegleria gruberi]EFC36242.1 predicted protein [Naegleria gruberi]|eukprot:XP_002668986.1 predicted protein [Naegleria gruberi strain NEG-M]
MIAKSILQTLTRLHSLSTVENLLYILNISFLATHELDAVDKKEWRLLFLLKDMQENDAKNWFIGLHLPLMGLLLLLTNRFTDKSLLTSNFNQLPRMNSTQILNNSQQFQRSFKMYRPLIGRSLLSTFLIGHSFVHYTFTNDPKNEFHSTLSKSYIYGGGVCGVLHLVSVGALLVRKRWHV